MTSTTRAVERPRQRPRDRRQQILNAARDLFVLHGYPSVTMAMIAEQVGITAGALYRHFGNKADILEIVIQENFTWLDDPVVGDDLQDAFESQILRIAEHPYITDLWIHEVRYLAEDSQRSLRRRMRAWHVSLAPSLRSVRPEFDEGQEDLMLWAFQSVLSCLSRRSMTAPEAIRTPAVRDALRALSGAPLDPTGDQPVESAPRPLPASMRERLLLAAFEQFGHKGFHETSTADIAAAAGVTGPNLYSYFQSKLDILRAVHERAAHALWISLDQVLASGQPAEDLLVEVVRSYVGLARTWSHTLDTPLGEAGIEEGLRTAQREYVDEWVALLTAIRPELGPRRARGRVQIALYLISDLYRSPRVSYKESFQRNLVVMVWEVLTAPPRSA